MLYFNISTHGSFDDGAQKIEGHNHVLGALPQNAPHGYGPARIDVNMTNIMRIINELHSLGFIRDKARIFGGRGAK